MSSSPETKTNVERQWAVLRACGFNGSPRLEYDGCFCEMVLTEQFLAYQIEVILREKQVRYIIIFQSIENVTCRY